MNPDLEELLNELLNRIDFPELDAICRNRWILEIILKICEAKNAGTSV